MIMLVRIMNLHESIPVRLSLGLPFLEAYSHVFYFI
jgi:hypothetical protein